MAETKQLEGKNLKGRELASVLRTQARRLLPEYDEAMGMKGKGKKITVAQAMALQTIDIFYEGAHGPNSIQEVLKTLRGNSVSEKAQSLLAMIGNGSEVNQDTVVRVLRAAVMVTMADAAACEEQAQFYIELANAVAQDPVQKKISSDHWPLEQPGGVSEGFSYHSFSHPGTDENEVAGVFVEFAPLSSDAAKSAGELLQLRLSLAKQAEDAGVSPSPYPDPISFGVSLCPDPVGFGISPDADGLSPAVLATAQAGISTPDATFDQVFPKSDAQKMLGDLSASLGPRVAEIEGVLGSLDPTHPEFPFIRRIKDTLEGLLTEARNAVQESKAIQDANKSKPE